MSVNGQDAVFVDLECYLNLWNTSGGRWDAVKVKFTELVVILYKGAFAFEDGDGYSGLLILIRGKGLRLLGRNDGTSGDDLGHDTTDGLNTKSKRSNINEKQILCFLGSDSTQDAALHCSTIGDRLVRVDATIGFLAVKELLDERLNFGNTG